jgi:hypothetical protein
MSYIGNTNSVQQYSPQIAYFSGDASTVAFTLPVSVVSAAQIIVAVANVIQNPSSAFTVSGTTLTFTSAPPSGTSNIWVQYTTLQTNIVTPAASSVGLTQLSASGTASSSTYLRGDNSWASINQTQWTTSSSNIYYNTLQVSGDFGLSWATDKFIGMKFGSGGSYKMGIMLKDTTRECKVWSQSSDSDDKITLYTGSTPTERVRVTSTGKVGVGVSSPDYLLDVRPTGALTGGAIEIFRGSTSGTGGVLNFRPSLGTAVDTIYNLSITAYDHSGDSNTDGLSINGYDGVSFCTGSNARQERMRIAQDGGILMGTTTSGGAAGITFSNASDTASYGKSMYMNSPYNGTRNAISFAYNSSGVGQIVTGTSSVSYASNSDYRLKENITPMTGALTKVAQLKPVTYKWKLDGKNGQGFIAHELQAVVPDCVTGEKDAVDADGKPVYQGVDTSFLVATLTAAIQEQQALIESLTERINSVGE